MSKTASVNLLAHLQGETLTISTLWRVVCVDGSLYFFTDHDEDIIFSGDTYKASTGYTRTSISSSVALDVDQLQIEGLIDDVNIDEDDLRAGKFDFAFVEISIINYAVPADGIMILRQGYFGEVSLKDQMYIVELRGLSQLFSREVLYTFNADCSADLGDSRCTIDLSHSDFNSTKNVVTAVTDSQTFTVADLDNPVAPGTAWDFGYIEWSDGKNAGRKMEVKSWNNSTKVLTLFLPMPLTVEINDEFDIYVGCDKLVPTCKDVYDNLNNFRGFPFIPTVREILKYPDTTSSGYTGGGS